MREAIAEAKKSRSEDNRPHPKVGAVLADRDGKILYKSHRGEEEKGGHAEFHIFCKAEKDAADLSKTTLFVTLEPCTRRGEDKVPCAVRVAESGVERIVIGTLDPNPYITGHGEMYLSYLIPVDRFPGLLVRELQAINKEFFDQYRNKQIPTVSLYAGGNSKKLPDDFRPALAGQREGILQQSMDLMTGTFGEIFIFAGDLSWLRELQIGLVLATKSGRRVRILCDKADQRDGEFRRLTSIARHLGADLGLFDDELPVRGTLVSADTKQAAMMWVEKKPTKHPILFQAPHESGIIKVMKLTADAAWRKARVLPAINPKVRKLDPLTIAEVLQKGIPQYAKATLSVCEGKINQLKPLATSLERFKLFRLNQVAIFQKRFRMKSAVIEGSPWAIYPPVVEKLPNGQLVIIDGSHRAYAAMQRGIDTIEVILVSGQTGQLPAFPLHSWEEVVVRAEKLPRAQRYKQFKPRNFRNIRSAVSAFVSQS